MKRIALITASVLALGAASIAADETDATNGSMQTEIAMASLTNGSAGIRDGSQLNAAAIRAAVLRSDSHSTPEIVRTNRVGDEAAIRLVRTPDVQATSCDDAHWPYYPPECLERVEAAGL